MFSSSHVFFFCALCAVAPYGATDGFALSTTDTEGEGGIGGLELLTTGEDGDDAASLPRGCSGRYAGTGAGPGHQLFSERSFDVIGLADKSTYNLFDESPYRVLHESKNSAQV